MSNNTIGKRIRFFRKTNATGVLRLSHGKSNTAEDQSASISSQ